MRNEQSRVLQQSSVTEDEQGTNEHLLHLLEGESMGLLGFCCWTMGRCSRVRHKLPFIMKQDRGARCSHLAPN